MMVMLDYMHIRTVYLPVSVDYIDVVRLRPINLIVSEREREGGEGGRKREREGEREERVQCFEVIPVS